MNRDLFSDLIASCQKMLVLCHRSYMLAMDLCSNTGMHTLLVKIIVDTTNNTFQAKSISRACSFSSISGVKGRTDKARLLGLQKTCFDSQVVCYSLDCNFHTMPSRMDNKICLNFTRFDVCCVHWPYSRVILFNYLFYSSPSFDCIASNTTC